MSKEKLVTSPTLSLVKDAMSFAVDEFVEKNPLPIDPMGYEIELQNLTNSECTTGCIYAACYLATKYPDSFSVISLLEAHRDVETFSENVGIMHHYFLAKGTDGIWYTGSPANHRKYSGANSRLKRVIFSQDVSKVLEEIQGIEGGLWPSKEKIEEVFGENGTAQVRIKNNSEIQVPVILNEGMVHCVKTKTVSPKDEAYPTL